MVDQKERPYEDLLEYAETGVDVFRKPYWDFDENPYEQILEEIDKPPRYGIQMARSVRDEIYMLADRSFQNNILGKYGLEIKIDSLHDELEFLSEKYENRHELNNEELLDTELAARGIQKIFTELTDI